MVLPRFFVSTAVCLIVGGGFFSGLAGQNSTNDPLFSTQQSDFESKKIVPYVPTPQVVVDRMLEMAQVRHDDVVYDLGSGDGRIVITAARRYGVKAVGFEIDPSLVQESREKVREAGLENLVEIHQQDILTVDLSPASVVTLYLFPEVNLSLRPNIQQQLKPGSRVVSHAFSMGDWKPLKSEFIREAPGWARTIYLWRIDEKTGNPGPE